MVRSVSVSGGVRFSPSVTQRVSRIMSNLVILPAPNIETGNAPESPWERERRAFHQLLPSLLVTHSGQYVAVHEGKVSPADATVSRWPWKPMSGLVMSLCSSGWSPKRTRAGESVFLHRASGEVRCRYDPISLQVGCSRYRRIREIRNSLNHTSPVGIIGPLLTRSCWTAKSTFQPIRGSDSLWETGLELVAA